MIRRSTLAVLIAAALAAPASAMVGGARESRDGIGRALVTIVGSRGNFCSGALIAPDLVLSAAHCVAPGADYKIVQRDAQGQPQLRDIRRLAAHPQFDLRAIQANRATADVALLQLAAPLPGKTPLPFGAPNDPLAAGQSFTVAGIGVAQRGDGKSGGVARAAELIATGRPGRLQIRLVDPATNNSREGQGACTGDSGGPALQQQDGRAVVIGVVSWSTGANNAAGCGGLTGVTPLTLYRDWIERTATSWGATLAK
ncbi:Peptidase S1 and S6, chymotrypsin/Hap [Rhodopseudomonas palustris HaA2]|uniref:Peptidase S1 and S6, chymotrypsin/Hap n=1 Tax=Rhodopseudomonas palustris (strain HaA2) TaxID=316058 RepID=Q2IUE5_RHOP2|nr:trypsin-like serine protease [Rhodopseudomonas palustris]ABD08165.1 Peptidase S1 and S6, chymotrypsin/Hap [Rhodopseudomonas palustris HaA2]